MLEIYRTWAIEYFFLFPFFFVIRFIFYVVAYSQV